MTRRSDKFIGDDDEARATVELIELTDLLDADELEVTETIVATGPIDDMKIRE